MWSELIFKFPEIVKWFRVWLNPSKNVFLPPSLFSSCLKKCNYLKMIGYGTLLIGEKKIK